MTNRLPDYWTHLDGSVCLSSSDPSNRLDGQDGQPFSWCDEHDRRVYPPVCGDRAGAYACTLAPHDPRIDHVDQIVAPGGVFAASYSRAFWSTGGDPVVVDPYASTGEDVEHYDTLRDLVPTDVDHVDPASLA
jgi:hypothetical protein